MNYFMYTSHDNNNNNNNDDDDDDDNFHFKQDNGLCISTVPPCTNICKPGLDFRKNPWGQVAPKFLDLFASTNFLVAKNFRPFRPKTFT